MIFGLATFCLVSGSKNGVIVDEYWNIVFLIELYVCKFTNSIFFPTSLP